MISHSCLLRGSVGTIRGGDEFDCPLCRRALLEAFRAPADPEEAYPGPARCAWCPLSFPARLMGAHVRWDHPHRYPSWVLSRHPAVAHATRSDALPLSDGRTGWSSACSCGWEKRGSVAGDQEDAVRTAEAHAYRHRTDPEGAAP